MDYKDQLDGLESSYKNLEKKVLANRAVERANKMLMSSTEFKEPRMQTLTKFYKLYDGKVDKKFRQLFNVALPIFPGLIDTLNAQFDTPVQLEFAEGEASDYFKAKKINAAWQKEHGNSSKNAMWEAKMRIARQHAIMTGRAVLSLLSWMTRWFRPTGRKSAEEIALDYYDLIVKGLV